MDETPFTVEQLDPSAIKVTIPGVGELVILRYTDDGGAQGARILEDLAPTAAPTTLEPA